MADVTDATFQTAVVERSSTVPVVVDLWAPWCGPCRQLGPIIERAVAATEGKVELVKVNVDENPQISQAFQVQSIPAVYAMVDGKVVDGFVGAQGEAGVAEFLSRLVPSELDEKVAALLAAGDESSLREALDLDHDHVGAVTALAELLIDRGDTDDALELLARVPEDAETRRLGARARTGVVDTDGDIGAKLDALLDQVAGDDDARQEFVDLLDLLGPDDPRTAGYRKALTVRLY
jgi:putative thioredoxin